MKKLFILFSLFAPLTTMAQDYVDFSVGINSNRYYKTPWTSENRKFSNSAGQGFAVLYGKEYYRNGKNTLRYSLGIETIAGDVISTYHGNGFSTSPQYAVNKTIVTLGVYPMNFHFWKYIDLNLGMTGTILVKDNSTIIYWVWDQGDIYAETAARKISSVAAFGLSTRLSSRFKLNKKLTLIPQYVFYFGIFNEIRPSAYNLSSMKHTFSLGLRYALNSTINCVPK